FSKGNIKSSEILEYKAPIKLILLEPNNPRLDSVLYTFTLSKSAGGYKIKDNIDGSREHKLGTKINSPIGPVMLVPQKAYSFDGDLIVSYTPTDFAVDALRSSISISPNKEKQSFLINFSMVHASREKAVLVLNSLIDQYNNDVTNDKAVVTKATSAFINSRLELISKDLESADSKVADFKDDNNMVDMTAEAQLYMQNATANEQKLVEYQTQLRLADMMRSAATSSQNSLLPSNIGLNDPSIQTNIKSYNDLVLEREDLLKSATPDNPIVQS